MIKIQHLTKYYGEHLALKDLSLEISEGHVYGFLGPNGAGKSTTMNIMTGCLSATEGTVCIDGHDIFEEALAAKKCIGYLPEHPPLYMNESPLEYLSFVGQAKGLRGGELKQQLDAVIEKTGIADVKHRRIAALSKGFKQRVGIAQALLGNPKVIILDEPTVGLDPKQIIDIRQLIKELGRSHTVIFSSHILSEVQAICDRIVMIAGGRLVAMGEPEELKRQLQTGGEIVLSTDAGEEEAAELLSQLEDISGIRAERNGNYTQLHISANCDRLHELSAQIVKCFSQNDKLIFEMSSKKGSLEDVFLELSENTEKEDEN